MSDSPTRRLRIATVVIVVSLAFSVTACSLTRAGSSDEATDSPVGQGQYNLTDLSTKLPAYAGSQPAWFTTDLKPASSAVDVSGVAVLYVHEGPNLFLKGLDPTTGNELWSRPATISGADSETGIGVTVLRNNLIAYLEPLDVSQRKAKAVIIDPREKSTTISQSDAKVFSSDIDSCMEDRAQACIFLKNGGKSTEWMLSPHNDGLRQVPDPLLTEPSFKGVDFSRLESGLYFRKEQPYSLYRYENGKIKWTKKLVDLAGKKMADNYNFTHKYDTQLDAYLINFTHQELEGKPKVSWREYRESFLVRASDGFVMKNVNGLEDNCDNTIRFYNPFAGSPVVLCEWIDRNLQKQGESYIPTTGKLALHRVDPKTGDYLWSQEIDNVTLSNDAELLTSGEGFIVTTQNGQEWVSLADGSHHPVPADMVNWQTDQVSFPSAITEKSDDGKTEHTITSSVDAPYAADELSPRITTPIPSGVGAHFPEMVVVATPKGVMGYSTTKEQG